jgi:hypothetical protein
LSLDLEHV